MFFHYSINDQRFFLIEKFRWTRWIGSMKIIVIKSLFAQKHIMKLNFQLRHTKRKFILRFKKILYH